MARQISRAEAWERAHEVYTQINFNAFDFNSIKESLLDYTKLYFPEDFNDYIESSEFIAILELFAYVGELLAYRIDLNAHENLITQAQRKESVLRLAKLISYNASRNIPARGLVKLTSIQTTETVIDSSGTNLAGTTITWNDSNNTDWKEQFLLVMNRVLEQEFGSVNPNERVQLDDVLFELYTWNNTPINTRGASVFSYSALADGQSFPMECVPVALTEDNIEEKRPEVNAKFSLLYGSDGLGDGSDTTGFFLYTKQGTLQKIEQNFDGLTPNQTFELLFNNINETDIWINHVNADTRDILLVDPNETTLPHLVSEDLRYGEWVAVDLANAQNILFNTNKNRHKYETETLEEDNVSLIFGDGEFSDIPGGSFDIWYRVSANSNTAIPRTSVVEQSSTFTYLDITSATQTLTFTFSLINSLQNSSESESIEHIRRVAPSVYYTQDRMVNGRDYNSFMLQDPSILKLRAVNRTFAGDSKYIAWHDPQEYYEDVKLFGDDLALYWDTRGPIDGGLQLITTPLGADEMVANVLEPLLSSMDFFQIIGPQIQQGGNNPGDMRRTFNDTAYQRAYPTTNEVAAIIAELNNELPFTLYYSTLYDEWTVEEHPCDFQSPTSGDPQTICDLGGFANSNLMIAVNPDFAGGPNLVGWEVRWSTRHQIAHSTHTRFWNTNTTDRVLTFDTLNSNSDKIILLKANVNGNEDGLLDGNKNLDVLGQELLEQNLPNAGLPDIHKLSVIPEDLNDDGIPDNLLLPTVFDYEETRTIQEWTDAGLIDQDPADASPGFVEFTLTLPSNKSFLVSNIDDDLRVEVDGIRYYYNDGAGTLKVAATEAANNSVILYKISLGVDITLAPGYDPVNSQVRIDLTSWVYFNRATTTDPWFPVETTDEIRLLWAVDAADTIEHVYKREPGRFPMNFAWFHYVERLNLVDPAASNIIDIYITTVAYYLELTRWLENRIDNEPTPPTPLNLRNSYANLLDNKMISDTVVLHPGKFKILFGSRAPAELRCYFSVLRPAMSSLTDNEVKVRIVDVIRKFFDIDNWAFGESFYYTEMSAAIHAELGPEIDSIVLVPTAATTQFGDLFQVQAREDEIFIPDINTENITIVQAYTPDNIRQDG